MNFLAHLYLSGNEEELIIGNFIADAGKGNYIGRFPEGIARGIRLHREIDHYTDHHPVFRQSRSHLVPRYGMFSGVIVDVYYDHFLAKYWNEFSDEDLRKRVAQAYFLLIRRFDVLPYRSRRILPFMISRNWLVNYRDLDMLDRLSVVDLVKQRSGPTGRVVLAAQLDRVRFRSHTGAVEAKAPKSSWSPY